MVLFRLVAALGWLLGAIHLGGSAFLGWEVDKFWLFFGAVGCFGIMLEMLGRAADTKKSLPV